VNIEFVQYNNITKNAVNLCTERLYKGGGGLPAFVRCAAKLHLRA